VVLATLLMEPEPPALALGEVVLHPHRQRRADPGKTIDEHPDQGAIPQPCQRIGGEVFEELSGLFRGEHRRLAAFDDVGGPPQTCRRWIAWSIYPSLLNEG
jgi:hypothetical protein